MKIPIPAAIIFATLLMVSCGDKVTAGPNKISRSKVMIVERNGLTLSNQAFTDSSPQKPIVIESTTAAKIYFSGKDLVKLSTSVDFTRHVVLVFAWKGSSRDKIEFAASKALPGKVDFVYRRGKTKDLRPQTRVYVLRKNVKWSTK